MSEKMVMTYEFISPQKAEKMLLANSVNRKISIGTVQAYTQDILNGNWDERVGDAISFDENGVLRNGQHRLTAIVKAQKGIHTWVCRNVSSNGIYDYNRKRSSSDQISIKCPDFEGVYKSPQYISVAKTIIAHNMKGSEGHRVVTPTEIIDFTKEHKSDLDGFFLRLPQTTIAKITIATVRLALFMAYKSGVDTDKILEFYEILCSGMSTKPEEFPIIAYRNYLKDSQHIALTHPEIARCQYALKKYLTGSCTKRSISPSELIYPFPYTKEQKDERKNS